MLCENKIISDLNRIYWVILTLWVNIEGYSTKSIYIVLGRCVTTINKVVKEFHLHGDFVDEKAPRLRKNVLERMPIRDRDKIRKVVSYETILNLHNLIYSFPNNCLFQY